MFGLSWGVIRLIGYGLLAAAVLGGLAWFQHEWHAGQVARGTVRVAHAADVRITRAVAASDRAAISAEAAEQTRIIVRTRTLQQKVNVYVPVSSPCVPWGVVRLHDAAVLHVDPGSLQPPAGQPDDACSDVAPRAFVDTVIANYGTADANA